MNTNDEMLKLAGVQKETYWMKVKKFARRTYKRVVLGPLWFIAVLHGDFYDVDWD